MKAALSEVARVGKGLRTFRLALGMLVLGFTVLSACGGGTGSSSGGPPPPPSPDFSLSITPQNLILDPGTSQPLNVSVTGKNGFTGSVNVLLSGIPPEITPSSTAFSLASGARQQITLSAPATAVYVTATVVAQGTSGNLAHTATSALTVQLPSAAMHAPIRTRYIRTDSFYDPNSLQFAPPHFAVYDQAYNRFLVSNPFLNRIDVFDAATEIQLGEIDIPGPWGLDTSPDGTKLYAGTFQGDVYIMDPALIKVTQRIPAAAIGPSGFIATAAFALADGRLALLGAQGGLFLDGSSNFAIWDPITNTIDIQPAPGGCPGINIGAFALSGDRSKVLLGSIDSDGTLCSYDPVTKLAAVGTFGGFLSQINVTLDGRRFFVSSESGTVSVFDTTSVQLLATFQGPVATWSNPPYSLGIYGAVMSLDGSTFYVVDSLSDLVAYDTITFQEKGWIPNYQIVDSQSTIVPAAIDPTGLIIGPIGHGVSFVDGSRFQPGTQAPQIGLGFPNPSTGPVSGGTSLQVSTSSGVQNLNIFPGLSQAFLGNAQLVNATTTTKSNNFPTIVGSTPSISGDFVADFTAVFTNQNVGLMPESFSYGPNVVEVVSNASVAEGGTSGALVGYGLGQTPRDLQISIGGTPATVTSLYPSPPIIPYPFPAQTVQFTVPPGLPGAAADISITNANGSTIAAGAFHYTGASSLYPLPNSSLQAGVYDRLRNMYYFTDQTKIQTLSPSAGWQTPITLPNVGSKTQLTALALSPDGSKLAISDFGDQWIYVLNPSVPNSAKIYPLPQQGIDNGITPTGLAVLDTGIIYFGTADLNGTGDCAFHKLNISSGSVTDFTNFQSGGLADYYTRVLLSPNQSRIYSQFEGIVFYLDTSNDQQTFGVSLNTISLRNLELAMSADGLTFSANSSFADANLNPFGLQVYSDRETWLPLATYGQKLAPDGSLMFQPLTDAIDVMDETTGRLLYRVQLPVQLPTVYDSLVANGTDAVVAAITTNGVILIDLNPLAQLSRAHSGVERPVIKPLTPTAALPSAGTTGKRFMFRRPLLRHAGIVTPRKPPGRATH